ncbi:MAG: PadR family transcriptional regulator, partial [Spirochaetales bacterium]
KPFTGYELKKIFANTLSFHWSGNNNQIYGTPIQLHKDGATTIEVQQQEKLPARKVYTITSKGRDELHAWLLSEPELPVVRDAFVARLAWASILDPGEMDSLLSTYAAQLEAHVLMYQEKRRRETLSPSRTPREAALWESIDAHAIDFYKSQLLWLRELKLGLDAIGIGNAE